jgi:peptide deformylase
MELLKFTDPQLRIEPTQFDFDKEDAKQLSDKLWLKCRELHGLGLSANQVGIDAKVFVMGSDDATRKNVFNPRIVAMSKETTLAKEGCLSYPGLWLTVSRPSSITISYQNVDGEYIVEELNGLPARVFQHEYDHMIGVNFSDHVSKLKLDMALKSLEKRAKRYVRKYVQHNL